MPKVTRRKVGQVLLTARPDGLWRAAWWDKASGRYLRRVLPHTKWDDVRLEAEQINAGAATGRGFYAAKMRGGDALGIPDAIAEAINHTNASTRTRGDYMSRANAFVDWLAKHRPGVTAWADLDEKTLADFLEASRQEGLAPDSLRMRAYVLRMTSRWLAQTRPGLFRDLSAGIKLRQTATAKQGANDDEILAPELLRALLARLSCINPMVATWATVQAYTGARVYEAAYLTEADIDFKAGTIRFASNEAHALKNTASARVVPMPKPVADALGLWLAGLKVRGSYLFTPKHQRRGRAGLRQVETQAGALSKDWVSRLWGDALKESCEGDSNQGIERLELPARFTAKSLRKCFVTHLRWAGADYADLQRFIGHRPPSIMSQFYDAPDATRLKAIATLAEQLAQGEGAFAPKQKNQLKTGADLH